MKCIPLKYFLNVFDRKTSIGVTSGLTFCGVVGHDHRHEYTGWYAAENRFLKFLHEHTDSQFTFLLSFYSDREKSKYGS